jgi:hypothetical protein
MILIYRKMLCFKFLCFVKTFILKLQPRFAYYRHGCIIVREPASEIPAQINDQVNATLQVTGSAERHG